MHSFPLFLGSFVIATIASGCGDSCFVRGTRIATPTGDRHIEDIAVGDVILAYSHTEHAVVPRRVVAIHRSVARETRTVVVANGEAERRLRATPSHPFWVESRREYVAVRDLRAGDALLLRTSTGLREAIVQSITAEEAALPSVDVFNISVETPESNYFAERVLVHNKSPLVNSCESADIAAGSASKVADEGTTAARYRLDVTLARGGTLRVDGYGRRPGAAEADVPLSTLEAKDTGDGRRWSIELVVENGMGATLVVSGESTAADGSSCSFSKTVDAP